MREERNSLNARFFGQELSVTGQFSVICGLIIAVGALVVVHARWAHIDAEQHAKEWANDVTAILASNDLVMQRQQRIIDSITKYCSAYYGLEADFADLEKRRKDAFEKRQKELEQRYKPRL
jgi:hypothetical protein